MADPRSDLLNRIVDDVARNGVGDRSLREVATAVGSSHRMLIYHFGSRAGLVAAIVAEVEARQRSLMATTDVTDDPNDVVRAVWQRVSDPRMRPFVQLFFEAAAYSSRRQDDARAGSSSSTTVLGEHGELTASWIEEATAIAARAAGSPDPVYVRLGIAVIRGLLVDVISGGDIEGATESLERFLTLSSAPGRGAGWRGLK
jgi:AcrR family transcriptional regulator